MSFAVIQTGGKQYKVKTGEIIKVEKLPDSKPETKEKKVTSNIEKSGVKKKPLTTKKK